MGFLRRLFAPQQTQSRTVEVTATLIKPDRSNASLEVVGEGSYQERLERAAGGRGPDGPLRREHVAMLMAEPANRYDENAIAVHLPEIGVVGYLSRLDGIAFGPVVRWARNRDRFIAC